MKKYQILISLFALFFLLSCLNDESAYLPQEKEQVNVDDIINEDNPDEDEELPEGQLVPGMHIVKLNVTQPDGQIVERRFKYYMPVSLNIGKPISLIFEFHGSYSFAKGVNPSNPLNDFKIANPLAQKSIKENCIICYPAGEVIYKSDSSGNINWQNSEKHLPFVDDMVDYFKSCTPTIDANRIYSTGQSSGAIFSFVLAFKRSEVFAAITPRAGQMSLTDQTEMPMRAVPVRVFAGEKDTTVLHSALVNNVTLWAEKIGGYFASDMKTDTLTIQDYAKTTIRSWHGGKGDIEIYSLADIQHNVSATHCMPYMWDFMAAHTLNGQAENLYVTSSLKEINARCGEPITFHINHTDGGTLEMKNAPDGWDTKLTGKTVTLTGPKNFYSDIDRDGKITFTVTKAGKTSSTTVKYKLKSPKDFFEVGDVFYNDDFEATGVVFWVNKADIREAKIININVQYGVLYSGDKNGLGIDFHTPDVNDGAGNTQKMVEKNKTLTTPLTASDAAFMWASSYSYKGIDNWYLPANNELITLASNVTKVNAVIDSLGGQKITKTLWSSTNEVKTGETTKTLYIYDLSTNKIVEKKASTAGSEYVGYAAQARAIKKVTK